MKIYLLPILLCTYFFSYSQSKKNTSGSPDLFGKMKKELIVFKPQPNQDNRLFPFSNIKVIDKRFDTSAIGYMKIYKNVYENYKLITDKGLSVDLESFLNSFYQKKITVNNYSLVIVLRKFWFYKNYHVGEDEFLRNKRRSDYLLNLGIDCFLFNDTVYTPLIRKDTTVVMDELSRESEKGTLLSETLKNIFGSLSLYNSITYVNKKSLSGDELEEYYNKNFRKPILSDDLKKGVYMNFDEFQKNAPSHTIFEVRKTNLADDIYLINNNDTIPIRNAWGYCDGKKIYIKSGNNLFELSRQGRGFSFIGGGKLTHQKQNYNPSFDDTKPPAVNLGAAAITQLIFADKFKLELFPMQLDMETGEVY